MKEPAENEDANEKSAVAKNAKMKTSTKKISN
jgi:hypothetical protein